MKAENQAVVVHARNAIFFGYLAEIRDEVSDPQSWTVSLKGARNAYYWKCDGGMLELANTGPKAGSKIGARADIELKNVIMIQICTPESTKEWESAIWTK